MSRVKQRSGARKPDRNKRIRNQQAATMNDEKDAVHVLIHDNNF